MKIFHLADLHFGKTIYGLSMLADQKDWTEKFLKLCANEHPDAVVIAGDVYDRSAPSGDAVELMDYFLTGLAEMQIHVFLIAGNHDSGQRLNFANTLLEREYIHIAGNIKKELKHYTFENPDGNGPVTIWMMPYTYPEQISVLFDDEIKSAKSEEDVSVGTESDISEEQKNGISAENFRTYEGAVRTLLGVQPIDSANRNIILSHQNVLTGGEEVERGGSETMVGGVGQIDYSVYNDFDYVALGHIHSAYPVGRAEVRYAGTPLCYHLNETRQKNKGVTEVILGAKGEKTEITMIPIEPLHVMRSISGTKDEVYDALANEMGDKEYVGVVLKDTRVKPEIFSYIKKAVENKDGVLLECVSDFREFTDVVNSVNTEAVKEKALEDLFADLYTDRKGGTPPGDEVYEVLQYVGELVRNQDSHQPLDEKNITKVIQKAKVIGNKPQLINGSVNANTNEDTNSTTDVVETKDGKEGGSEE